MALNPIGIALPFFLGLMVFESRLAKRQGRPVYRLNDTFTDLSCGLGEQALGVFGKALILVAYAAVETRVGVVDLPLESAWTWAIGMIGVDFFYYWYHRFSHRVNFAWLTHSVHHQSEEYNLAVALRQPWFTQAYSWMFYLPLAVLGVPAIVYMTCFAINLVYQFWIHTRLIEKMGMFETVFNTPSHHRVHHGTNPEYIDRNYAGILIIWDRIFGTFEPEIVEPVYGILKPLRSWNPAWANVGPWVMLARRAAAMPRWRDRIYAWFAPPEWIPEGSDEQPASFPSVGRDYNEDSQALHQYILLHMLPVLAGGSLVLLFEQNLPLLPLLCILLGILWTAVNWGGMFERRSWSVPMEFARLGALSVASVALAMAWAGPWSAALLTLPLWGASAFWYWNLRLRQV